MTAAEFDLLRALCDNAGHLRGRDDRVPLINGQTVQANDHPVDTPVSRLRQKMELAPGTPVLIRTVRNGGCVLVPPVEVMS
ncbi:MAG: winged helix-turn-helix domain-containing protein [Paracoccaceae bacterium]